MIRECTLEGEMGPARPLSYNRFLLLIAGLGGLLYGIDIGIIAGALPYLEATSGLSPGQLSAVVAAVLLGTVVSTLFAGTLADRLGRQKMMVLSGALFVASIPIIALAAGYVPLLCGRLLQGISGGLIGVVVPLYLAECLPASSRGKGTATFQWLLTLGILAAALASVHFSIQVAAVEKLGDPGLLRAAKDHAWRSIFWVSLPPGVLFTAGAFFLGESPRWLLRRGQERAARAALARSRPPAQLEDEFRLMQEAGAREAATRATRGTDSVLRRKYIVPFLLACAVLALTQATGAASIIAYNATILMQAGLTDLQAHTCYLVLTAVNFLATIIGVVLVDRKGRRFLLSLGTTGILAALLWAAVLFHRTERTEADCRAAVQALVEDKRSLKLEFDGAMAERLLARANPDGGPRAPCTLAIVYSYGDYYGTTKSVRSDSPSVERIQIDPESSIPANRVVAFFSNPFAGLAEARSAPLVIRKAIVKPVPGPATGWQTAWALWTFIAFFAVGPGVCVWLALSELMPTRIRSNGMSIALLLNQAVSTTIAASFLPAVGRYGYATLFLVFAACTLAYLLTAVFLLPETRGKTLEEIERHFDQPKAQT